MHDNPADSHVRAVFHPVLTISPDDLIEIFLCRDIGSSIFEAKEVPGRFHAIPNSSKS